MLVLIICAYTVLTVPCVDSIIGKRALPSFRLINYAAIWRHNFAHSLQASAQRLHCSLSDLSHSLAQASQTSAHKLDAVFINCEFLAQYEAHKLQVSTQSRHSLVHSFISGIPSPLPTQRLHSATHLRQASIHFFKFSFIIPSFKIFLACTEAKSFINSKLYFTF